MKPKRGKPFRRQEEPYKINNKIYAKEVRLVGENVEVGVYSLSNALAIATEQNLDLVEISPKADPPVCKVIDYSKFKYEQKKKQKQLKAKSQKTSIKEIRFGPNTGDHDFNFKLKHAIEFLKSSSKVKVYVHFSGREIVFKERGKLLLLRFVQELEEFGTVDELPKMEGRRMIVMISPKKS